MPVMNPPNSPNTILVQVPLPQPVQSSGQNSPPPVPQPAPEPKKPKPVDPFKKIKGPPVMILPHINQGKVKMGRTGKPIKFSKEAAEALVPRVQTDHHDMAARGALADALEESGLHHDQESLDHLRAFDRPVYGMLHPESNKYVFSPRRRWLLGELIKPRKGESYYSKYLNSKNRKKLADPLRSIGLHAHASFFDGINSFLQDGYISEDGHLPLEDFRDATISNDWGTNQDSHLPNKSGGHWYSSTMTPQGTSFHLSDHISRVGGGNFDQDELSDFFDGVHSSIAKEHKEMQEEDRLYSDPKKKEQFKKKRKRIKFSREAAEALVPIVQADPHDYAARGALADALEESGLHHDQESLDHLRAFDRPVYGMLHPESNKYVFSPRRRWLLGELLRGKAKRWIAKSMSDDAESGHDEHSELVRKLKEIGLPNHASFLSEPGRKNKTIVFDSSIASVYSPEHETLKDDVNPRWGKNVTTATSQGFGLKMIHPRDYYSGYIHDDLELDYQKRKKEVAQEHREMNKEDRLYSNSKKKEQFNKKRKPIKFARHDIPEIMDSIASNPDDPMLHTVLTDALEEQGYTALPNLIRSHLNGGRSNQEMPLVKAGDNPMNDFIDNRSGELNWWVHPYGAHGDFHVFHEFDGDQKDNNHILYFVHDNSARTGHPQVRYQFQLAPHEFHILAEDMSDDEKDRLSLHHDGDIETGGNAGHQIKRHIDSIITNLARQQQEPEDAEPIPFNRKKFNRKHWESDEFKNWFGDWQSGDKNVSKVTNPDGTPKVVYHGTQRADRVGDEFKKNRATSGPMSFFTDDPEIASSYSTNKRDTSLEDEGYDKWFKIKHGRSLVDLPNYWHYLDLNTKGKIASLAGRVGANDDGDLILHPEGHNSGTGGYDYHIKEARGNHFKALIEEWLNSGNLINSERDFLKVLKMAGMDYPVEIHDPHASYSGVVPAYLSIKKPLDTHNIPNDVIASLEKAARRVRKKPQLSGADFWDKNTRDPIEWIESLKQDNDAGINSYVWTSIPDWVTKTLKSLGYDGIHDRGNKGGAGDDHHVFIPFEPHQIKSAIANKGKYSPKSKKTNLSRSKNKAKFGLLESTGKKIDSALGKAIKSPTGAVNAIGNEFRDWKDSISEGRFFEHSGRNAERVGNAALGAGSKALGLGGKAVRGIAGTAMGWAKSLYNGLKAADRKISPMLERILGIEGSQPAPVKKKIKKPIAKKPVQKPAPKQSRADRLFGDHEVRKNLNWYATRWAGHKNPDKHRISQLAKTALRGNWYSRDNKDINIFHEIQRQLHNLGHEDANRIKWANHHDELVKKIRSKKKMNRKGKTIKLSEGSDYENKIILDENHLGNSYGQDDYRVVAKKGDKQVGYADYSVFNGSPSIKYIEVHPDHRRSGIGTILMRHIQDSYPDAEVELGIATEDGSNLVKSLKRKFHPNNIHSELTGKLNELQKRYSELQSSIDKFYGNPTEESRTEAIDIGDEMNLLNDQIESISKKLKDTPSGKWLYKSSENQKNKMHRRGKSKKLNKALSYADPDLFFDQELDKIGRFRTSTTKKTKDGKTEKSSPGAGDAYISSSKEALGNKTNSIVPHVDHLASLAEIGEPVKGSYSEAGQMMEHLLKSPDDAHRFIMANAILSPQSDWVKHTAGAIKSLAEWHLMGRPDDEDSMDQLFGVLGRNAKGGWIVTQPGIINKKSVSMFTGAKARALKRLFSNPVMGVDWNTISQGSLKTPNFGLAFVDHRGVPIDAHMSKLLIPDRWSEKKIREIMADGGLSKKKTKALLEAQKAIGENPAHAMAYKTLIGATAKHLGWEPREVQEAVWTALVGIMAIKKVAAGQPLGDQLKLLSNRALRAGWDLGTVLLNKKVINDLSKLGVGKSEIEKALEGAEKKRPTKPGSVSVGRNYVSALEDVASRLKSEIAPAAKPIVKKLKRKGDVVKMSATSPEDHLAFHNAIAREVFRGKFKSHTPSLAYADFLEEHGHPHIASHIRDAIDHGEVKLMPIPFHPKKNGSRKIVGVVHTYGSSGLKKILSLPYRIGRNSGHIEYSLDNEQLRDMLSKGADQDNELKNLWDYRAKSVSNLKDESDAIGSFDKKPERMSRFRSPAGGMLVRGQFYPGGKLLPKEATQTNPPPDKSTIANKKRKKKRNRQRLYTSHSKGVHTSENSGVTDKLDMIRLTLDRIAKKSKMSRSKMAKGAKPQLPQGYWIDGDGNSHFVGDTMMHENYLTRNRLFRNSEDAYAAGWQRVNVMMKKVLSYGTKRLTSKQSEALGMIAIRHGADEVNHLLRGEQEPKPVKLSKKNSSHTSKWDRVLESIGQLSGSKVKLSANGTKTIKKTEDYER